MEKLTKREKIMIGVAVVGLAALGCVVYHNGKETIILKEACSEGLFEEAIATVTRKLNSRKDKLEILLSDKNVDPQKLEKIKKLRKEIGIFEIRKANFIKAQNKVGIR